MSKSSVEPTVFGSGIVSCTYEGFAGLGAMIVKFAKQTWARIPEAQRRHMDFEDVMQETQMRAYTAIATYDPLKTGPRGKVCKLSSWVYGTLALRMREVNAPYTDPSRNSGRVGIVVDIADADVILPPVPPETEIVQNALSAFSYAYREADASTQQLFLDTLGFRTKIKISTPDQRAISLDVATRCRLTADDIRTLRTQGPEKCLSVAVKYTKVSGMKLPEIECVLCGVLYPVSEAGKSIDVKTLVCSNCYEQQAVGSATCFAKDYDGDALECTQWCPDRTVCAAVSIKGEYMGIKVSKGTAKSTPAPKQASESDDPFETSGQPVGTLIIGSEQLEVEENPVDGHDDEQADGELDDEELDDELEELDSSDAPAPEEISLNTVADDDPFLTDEPVQEKPKTASPAPQPSRQKVQEPVATKAITKAPAAKVAVKKSVAVKATPTPAKSVQISKAKPAPAPAAPRTSSKAPASKSAPVKAAAASKPKRKLKEFKPQYWTGLSPFRPGTAMHSIFEKLIVPEGVKLKHLKSFVERKKLNWRGVRHNLAKGTSFNAQWTWKLKIDEESGVASIKITGKPSAEYRKACGEKAEPVPVKAKAKK
jgi:hypothetical protein